MYYYIDDIHPVRTIDYEKYRKHLAMRKEQERLLKNFKYVNHAEWRIRKKLYEERFSKVYFYMARGNGKWRAIDEYLDILESGRDIEIFNAKHVFKKPERSECLLDWDSCRTLSEPDELYFDLWLKQFK